MTLFTNVANGSRHIDWKSALGQFQLCKIVDQSIKEINNLELFKDIGIFSITNDVPVKLNNNFNVVIGDRYISKFGIIIRKIPDCVFDDNFRVCSIASLSSLINKPNNLLKKTFEKQNLDFLEFFEKSIFGPLFNLFFDLYRKKGIILETHCQNVLVLLTSDYNFTGKFLYRDFDLITLDRIIFPENNLVLWNEYCNDRPDRISLKSNLEMRDNIGICFYMHFFNNLIVPLLQSAMLQNLISKKEFEKYKKQKFQFIKTSISRGIPYTKKLFLLKNNNWKTGTGIYSVTDFDEVKCKTVKIEIDRINKTNFTYLKLNKRNKRRYTYYSNTDETIIYQVNNKIIYGMYINKIRTKKK